MEGTCFRFVPSEFICLHYWDRLHLVLAQASRQMFALRSVPTLFIIVNSRSVFHATLAFRFSWKSGGRLSRASEKCSVSRSTCRQRSDQFHVLFALARMLQLSQSVADLPVALADRICHE